MLKQAYQLGVLQALQDSGLTKTARLFGGDEGGSEAWPAFLGNVGGAIAAPEGKKWRGYAGAEAGGALGTVAGVLGGGLTGAGLAALLRQRPEVGALLGAVLGGGGGAMYGGVKGYRAAIED